MSEQHSSEIHRYCAILEELKLRLRTVQLLSRNNYSSGADYFVDEAIFLHLRKSLELLAFASMTGHFDAYSTAYSRYQTDWNAKRIIKDLEKIHPHFYPTPLRLIAPPPGHPLASAVHLENIQSGFLTKEDFITLYDLTSKAIHSPNPFSKENAAINLQRPVNEWVDRILLLLRFHHIVLAESPIGWLIHLEHPEHGRAYAQQSLAL